jgi:hypothetical protein
MKYEHVMYMIVTDYNNYRIVLQNGVGAKVVKSMKYIPIWGRRDRDRMVVGFSTTCAISAYHH